MSDDIRDIDHANAALDRSEALFIRANNHHEKAAQYANQAADQLEVAVRLLKAARNNASPEGIEYLRRIIPKLEGMIAKQRKGFPG